MASKRSAKTGRSRIGLASSLAALVLLALSASSQGPPTDKGAQPQGGPQEVVNAILNVSKAFCMGVGDGGGCRVSAPWDRGVSGVCCQGYCRFNVASCGEKPANQNLREVFQKASCMGVAEGGGCVFPPEVAEAFGKRLSGACCGGLCQYGLRACPVKGVKGSAAGESDSPVVSKGLPAGVCGNRLCEKGEEESCPQDCSASLEKKGLRSYWWVVVVAGLAVLALVFHYVRSRKLVEVEAKRTRSVKELLAEKEELEKLLVIAKKKYHHRELDEDSFREIVKDSQKKLIELELKIRVNKP